MIRFIHPHLPQPEEWVDFLAPAYKTAWFSNFGLVCERFAAALTEKYCDKGRVAVPVSSCTAGLTSILMALGIRGKVVIPSFTFSATAQAVLQAGCTPVFCDVDTDTWLMSASKLREYLASNEADAVLVVRSYGFGHDLTKLDEVCSEFSLPMVVDAASGLGGKLENGEWVGNQGIVEVFSLHATKVFGIGEGGVVFCTEELAKPLRSAVNFGMSSGDIHLRGLNGKMSEFAAAIGLAMLEKIDHHISNRKEYVTFYRQRLAPFEQAGEIDLPPQHASGLHWTFPIRLRRIADSSRIVDKARQRGLELGRYYSPALHTTGLFRTYAVGAQLNVTDMMAESMICLPVYSEMDRTLLQTVCDIVQDTL